MWCIVGEELWRNSSNVSLRRYCERSCERSEHIVIDVPCGVRCPVCRTLWALHPLWLTNSALSYEYTMFSYKPSVELRTPSAELWCSPCSYERSIRVDIIMNDPSRASIILYERSALRYTSSGMSDTRSAVWTACSHWVINARRWTINKYLCWTINALWWVVNTVLSYKQSALSYKFSLMSNVHSTELLTCCVDLERSVLSFEHSMLSYERSYFSAKRSVLTSLCRVMNTPCWATKTLRWVMNTQCLVINSPFGVTDTVLGNGT